MTAKYFSKMFECLCSRSVDPVTCIKDVEAGWESNSSSASSTTSSSSSSPPLDHGRDQRQLQQQQPQTGHKRLELDSSKEGSIALPDLGVAGEQHWLDQIIQL